MDSRQIGQQFRRNSVHSADTRFQMLTKSGLVSLTDWVRCSATVSASIHRLIRGESRRTGLWPSARNTKQLLGIRRLPGYLPHWVARKWTWSDWPSSVSLESQIAFSERRPQSPVRRAYGEKHDELVFHLSLIAQVRPQDHPAIMAQLRKVSSEKPPRPTVRLCDFSLSDGRRDSRGGGTRRGPRQSRIEPIRGHEPTLPHDCRRRAKSSSPVLLFRRFDPPCHRFVSRLKRT